MDLTPLYDLRDRLKTGAVAGTALLGDDFRLSRALEALGPLEQAAPVFQKIGQQVRALLASDCPDKAAALLDALSLCDAVCTTQGAVGVSGPVEPLGLSTSGETLVNAPYSLLNPLIEALTGSGGGRYSSIVETREQRPALFRDYRVKHALVAALGAGYAELAEKAAQWLIEDGSSVVPLLKAGFDPQGKKAMVRRVQVLESICGAAENDFYLELLDGTCEKEIRAAAVYALRHDEKNADRLVSLCKTEKGAAKKFAHWALARLESDTAWHYWSELSAKHPEQAAEYMTGSTTLRASALIAESLCQMLAKTETTNAYMERLQSLMYAFEGKHGPEICAVYRQAAGQTAALESPLPDTKKPFFFHATAHGSGGLFEEALSTILLRTLAEEPFPELCALAEELYQAHGTAWLAPVLLAALRTKDASAAFETAKPVLDPGFSLFGKKPDKQKVDHQLEQILQPLSWNREQGQYLLRFYRLDPIQNRTIVTVSPLRAALDIRWFSALCKRGSRFDEYLFNMMNPENPEIQALLSKHFYNVAMVTSDNRKYLTPLKSLGWTKFEGLLHRYCDGQKRLNFWHLRQYLTELPLSTAQKITELEPLIKQFEQGKLGFQGNSGLQSLKDLIAELKKEA